jgi:hypothetical protein
MLVIAVGGGVGTTARKQVSTVSRAPTEFPHSSEIGDWMVLGRSKGAVGDEGGRGRCASGRERRECRGMV